MAKSLPLFSIIYFLILLTSCINKKEIEVKNYKEVSISKDSIDKYLGSKMEELGIPGLSYAIINDGKVVHNNVFGFSNLEETIPVSNKTIFEGASISKSVFAFFAMKYVEEGRLNLDKPLFEYLPYPDIASDERYKQITARMILSHRSGLPNWRNDEEGQMLKIKFEPGTNFLYSGEGYQYLALVLRHLEGTDWNGLESAFQSKIAKPLGLEHTVFMQNPYTRENKAVPYEVNKKRLEWEKVQEMKIGEKEFGAAYSIHTEPLDFSKWMIAVMKKELLSEASYKELFQRHSEVAKDDIDVYYALGFYTLGEPLDNLYLHSGSNPGFTCYYVLDIKKDWGYVLFTNSQNGESLGGDFFDFLDKEKY